MGHEARGVPGEEGTLPGPGRMRQGEAPRSGHLAPGLACKPTWGRVQTLADRERQAVRSYSPPAFPAVAAALASGAVQLLPQDSVVANQSGFLAPRKAVCIDWDGARPDQVPARGGARAASESPCLAKTGAAPHHLVCFVLSSPWSLRHAALHGPGPPPELLV